MSDVLARARRAQQTAKAIRAAGGGWVELGEFSFRSPERDRLVVFHAGSDRLLELTSRQVDAAHPEEIGLVGLIMHAGVLWRLGQFQQITREFFTVAGGA